MLETLAKSMDLLKASGWQAAMIAVACGVLIYLSGSGVIPGMEPWIVLLVWAAMVVTAGLALAALLSASQRPISAGWKRFQAHLARKRREQTFRDYVPYLSDKERQILGYLREKKLKTFDSDIDGGYASTLMARGFIIHTGVPGQVFDPDRVTMIVPDYVWKVMQEQPDQFPYTPEYSEGRDSVETHPWRIPWMLR